VPGRTREASHPARRPRPALGRAHAGPAGAAAGHRHHRTRGHHRTQPRTRL